MPIFASHFESLGRQGQPECCNCRLGLSVFPVRRLVAKHCNLMGDGSVLTLQIAAHGTAKARVPDPMGAIGRHREIAAGELMRALGTGLDPRELVPNGIVDRSI